MTEAHTPTAEDLLAGAMLLNDDARHGARERGVTHDSFQGSNLRQLVEVVRDMDDLNLPVEATAISNHASRFGYDIHPEWVTDLRTTVAQHPVVLTSWSYYVDLLLETERRVRATKAAQHVIDKIRTDPTLDVQNELASALIQIQKPPHELRGGWITDLLPQFLDDTIANWNGEGEAASIPTGLSGIDDLLRGGMRPGELVIAGARPGMGKTAWALQVANNVARQGKRVVVFSAEMTANALLRRASAEFAKVPAPLIDKRGPAGHERLERMRQDYLQVMRNEMIHLPVYIDDTSRPSVAYMLDKARRLGDIDLVIFDYLGLADDAMRANASTTERASKVANDLMMMAKELNVPVIALSQLNRSVEQQKPYHPTLAHLRDSGQVEANAHIVLLLYRKRYYIEQGMLEDDDTGDHLDIYVAKNREGKTGAVRTRFDGGTFSVTDA